MGGLPEVWKEPNFYANLLRGFRSRRRKAFIDFMGDGFTRVASMVRVAISGKGKDGWIIGHHYDYNFYHLVLFDLGDGGKTNSLYSTADTYGARDLLPQNLFAKSKEKAYGGIFFICLTISRKERSLLPPSPPNPPSP